MWDLSEFSLLDMLRCSRGLREVTAHAETFDAAATAVVGYFYSQFADPVTKDPQCALVRFYKTSAFRDLEQPLRDFALGKVGSMKLAPETRVLTLVATVGSEPAWCDRRMSVGHQAIPLPSVAIVEQAPMIAGLIKALGLDIAEIVSPSPGMLQDKQGKTYNVFHVENARGSEFIPAQDEFVVPYKIQSVVGFGGLLPTGELFALVLFSRVHIGDQAASRFRSVALDVKAIMHPLAHPPSIAS